MTRRAAPRAKQLLNLMIQLGHCDPERHYVTSTTNDDDNDDGVEMELIESYRYLTWIGVNPGCVNEADDEEIDYDDDYIVSNPILIIRNGRRNHRPFRRSQQSLV